MPIPEATKHDWNTEVLPSQIKEQHPMDVVAQNAKVKQLHSQLLNDLDGVRREKALEEYDHVHDPVTRNQ